MELINIGVAGTYESSDIYVTIQNNDDNGIEINLTSSVEKQFGDQIRKVIKETLEELSIKNAKISANDTGALDCVIKARVQCAVFRAANKKEGFDWGEIK